MHLFGAPKFRVNREHLALIMGNKFYTNIIFGTGTQKEKKAESKHMVRMKKVRDRQTKCSALFVKYKLRAPGEEE